MYSLLYRKKKRENAQIVYLTLILSHKMTVQIIFFCDHPMKGCMVINEDMCQKYVVK